MLKQILQESFFSTKLLSVIFVMYGTASHFEIIVPLPFLMQF